MLQLGMAFIAKQQPELLALCESLGIPTTSKNITISIDRNEIKFYWYTFVEGKVSENTFHEPSRMEGSLARKILSTVGVDINMTSKLTIHLDADEPAIISVTLYAPIEILGALSEYFDGGGNK